MNRKVLLLLFSACLLLLLVAFATRKTGKTEFEAAREIIVMRDVAHQLLLYTGDSTSRVLPVKQLSETEFLIPFESVFAFTPDSLVRIIDRVIDKNQLPSDYIVNVIEPVQSQVIFGYAISHQRQESLVPCSGREQPAKKYSISIRFKEESSFIPSWVLLSAIVLLTAGLALLLLKKPVATEATVQESWSPDVTDASNLVPIGKYRFDTRQQLLLLGDEQIILTSKEAKLLTIFSANVNDVIDRNRLQKEVWEDEGVIVGRSLDVFISKLRKKFEKDPSVKLVNIHGKGYKLEVG